MGTASLFSNLTLEPEVHPLPSHGNQNNLSVLPTPDIENQPVSVRSVLIVYLLVIMESKYIELHCYLIYQGNFMEEQYRLSESH